MYRLLALLLLAAPAFCTKVKPCPGETRTSYVQVGECEDNCTVSVGTNLTHHVIFKPDHDVSAMTYELLNDTTVLMTNSAACDSLVKGSCPLSKDDEATLLYFVDVTSALAGYVDVTFRIRDQDSVSVACYKLDVTVT